MRVDKLIIKIALGVITLYFIVSEAHYILNLSYDSLYDIFASDSALFLIIILKFGLIFFVLPFLYLLKLLDFLGVGFFERRGVMMEGGYLFFQTKLFYWLTYSAIFVLIIIRIIEQISGYNII